MFLIQISSTKDMHIKISDLKKGSNYDIRITARNHVGYGKPYQPDEPIVAGKRISKTIIYYFIKSASYIAYCSVYSYTR